MSRIFLLLTIVMLHPAMLCAQTVTATFRNAVEATPVTAGTLSLYNLSNPQWVFQNQSSGYQTMISVDTDYRARTDQDRLTISSELFKHHRWDDQVNAYLLTNDFSVSLGTHEITKTAVFTNARKTTLFHNFEEFTDEGRVRFHDPWYVNDQGLQPGGILEFPSPHIPTGAYGESQPAVLLDKQIRPGDPFYSLKFHSFLQGDYETPKDAPLTSDDWVFVGSFARSPGDVNLAPQSQSTYWTENSGLWQRSDEFNVDVEFTNDESELFGFYKRHRHSSSEIEPTAINSQRKIAQEWTGSTTPPKFHQVYESDGKIYYTWSEDDGATWEGEVLVSDFYHNSVHPVLEVGGNPYLITISFVDVVSSQVVIKQRFAADRPTLWSTVDEIDISNPSVTHPTVGTKIFDGHYFTFLIWEDQHDLRYSVYMDGDVLTGTRIQGASTIPDVTFDALVLESGWIYPKQSQGTPKYPTLTLDPDFGFYEVEGFVTWSERSRQTLRYKGLAITNSGSVYQVRDANPFFISNSHPIRDNTAPSACVTHFIPHVAYEADLMSVGFPIPTQPGSWPVTIMSRAYYPITASIAGFINPWFPYFNRVVIKSAGVFPYFARSFPYVTQVHLYPAQTNDVLAPSIEKVRMFPTGNDIAVAANYSFLNREYSIASYRATNFPIFSPSTVTWNLISNGTYPQISSNNFTKSMVAFTDPDYSGSTAGYGSMVAGNDILYEIGNSTGGVRKAAEQVRVDEMRQLAFSQNDSARIFYGIATPHSVQYDTVFTAIGWDPGHDTLPYFWWNDLNQWIKTEPFLVPQNGKIVFGNEMFAEHVEDFGEDFRLAIQFRNALDDEVLYSEVLNFSDFNLDSAAYVEDRIDLSSISGNNVYMCITPLDTASGCSFDPVYVVTPWFESIEKRSPASAPNPQKVLISQNYPNPFNPSSIVPYELRDNGFVSIQVFDLYGRLVATPFHGVQRSGHHTVPVDGRQLQSGVYVCRISGFGQSSSIRMHLVK